MLWRPHRIAFGAPLELKDALASAQNRFRDTSWAQKMLWRPHRIAFGPTRISKFGVRRRTFSRYAADVFARTPRELGVMACETGVPRRGITAISFRLVFTIPALLNREARNKTDSTLGVGLGGGRFKKSPPDFSSTFLLCVFCFCFRFFASWRPLSFPPPPSHTNQTPTRHQPKAIWQGRRPVS